MPIDPRIALGVQPLQVPDPLAQYGQVQNILAAQTQRQTGQLHAQQLQFQMDQAKEAHDYVTQVMATAKENGAPTDDPMEAAMQMLRHPNPQVQAAGGHLLDSAQKVLAYQQDRAFAARGQQPSPVAAAPSTVVGPSAPIDEAMTLDYVKNAPAGVSYKDFAASQNTGLAKPVAARTPVVTAPLQAPGMTPAPVINNLPAAAAAPVAPVNQLATPVSKVDQIDAEIADLMSPKYMYSQQAKSRIEFLNKRRDQLTKAHVVGTNLVTEEGKAIYTGKEKDSEFEQLLAKSNLSENEKMAMRVARAKKESSHAPPISVSYGQEKAEASDYGKLLVENYKGIQAASNLAQKSMPAIESNLAILDKGFDTGFATETKTAGAKVLAALGVKDAEKYATNAQTFLANANAAVLQRQLEQKGPQTESDAQRISATGAQLGNTKDANRFVLNVAKAQLQRDIDQRNFYADWRKTHKTFDGADDAWNSGPGSKSLFDTPVLKKYAMPTGDQTAPTKDNRPPLSEIFKDK